MRSGLLLLLCALGGCTEVDSGIVAVPRTRLTPEAILGSFSGMNYDPRDLPLAWGADGRIIIAHTEIYSGGDVFSSSCAGSGFYEIAFDARTVRPIQVGQGFCLGTFEDGVSMHSSGRTAIVSHYAEVNRSRLSRIDLSTGKIDSLTTGCQIYEEDPAISPDGQWVAAKGLCANRDEEHYRVYTARLDGSGYRYVPPPASGSYSQPAWSPDGRKLAMVRSYGGEYDMSISEVWVMDVEGRNPRLVGRGTAPSWSPAGEWIAFVANDHRSEESALRIVAPDGSSGREVFRNRARGTFERGWGPQREGIAFGPLVWSPDGKQLLFPRRFDDGTSVWRVELGSGAVARVTRADR
jgi:Tol biopolymer transport system component